MQKEPGKNTVIFKQGETIFQDRDPCDALYIIQVGKVEVFKKKGQSKVLIGTVGPGEYLGETALFRGTPHSSSAIAATEVIAVKLPKGAIDAQLKTAPTWLVALTRGLVFRLHQANEVIRKAGISTSDEPTDDSGKKSA